MQVMMLKIVYILLNYKEYIEYKVISETTNHRIDYMHCFFCRKKFFKSNSFPEFSHVTLTLVYDWLRSPVFSKIKEQKSRSMIKK